ncbi:g1406 [Coccomyxa viridis]|uniref:G1406 protein n=1 Tax=Coccomyxa viridis TaxID=1274662 RepID=A0ABP1FPS4_9CHLO
MSAAMELPRPSLLHSQHVDLHALASSSRTGARALIARQIRRRRDITQGTVCSATLQRPALSTGSHLPSASWRTDFSARYTLGSHIGSGSYGVVHLCIDKATGQKKAAKIMPKVRAKQTLERTQRKLEREVALMTRISKESRAVAQLVDVFEDRSYVYIVMDLLEGGDLEQLLEAHGAFSERAAAVTIYECLKIISVCHANGVLLGDIKPANFMLRKYYKDPIGAIEKQQLGPSWLKAIDFGCSQSVGHSRLQRRTGTPVYMSPETFRREYYLEADLWSLGMMLYQLIAARFPFWSSIAQCRTRSLEEVMKAVIMDNIPLDYGPWLTCSPECLDFLKGLLMRDPAQRMTATEALEHPWFRRHFDADAAKGLSRSSNNIVPLVPGAPRCSFYSSCASSVLRSLPV